MKRLLKTLAATFAVLAATAGSAFAAGPVQSGIQSSSTDQAAIAASSATQVQPSNQDISVRVLSPGDDGAVSQSNDASSTANASNTAATTQSTSPTLASGCGCVIRSGSIDDVLGTALQAASGAPDTSQAQAPAPTGSTQSNDTGSTGTSANTAPTGQAATQSSPAASGVGGVQSSQQDASTDQTAIAASSATQVAPSNSNISVRVLSPGNDGAVSQSNKASSSADASNSAATTQGSSQTGSGSAGVQSSTQGADTKQGSLAESSATQIHPENSNVSVRVLSPGNGGSVSQSNEAESSANAKNIAPVTQTSTQSQSGPSCGCASTSPAVQAIGQTSSVDQGAAAASSAEQIHPSNVSDPVRIASDGNDGSLTQSNEVSSEANAYNIAPVSQTGSQQHAPSSCGCSSGPAVQALGQSSEVEQLGIALSSAQQAGATNESGPIRIASDGNGGAVSQSNEAESSAGAANIAPVSQTGTQQQAGSGVQALGQESEIKQAALAASAVFQLPGESRCGCGSSSGNSADPVRIWSDGNDGNLNQSNEASSSADASNFAAPTQRGTQTQASPSCGCRGGLGVQALGQLSTVDQIAAALSSAKQIGASNASGPVRVWSTGGGGRTRQSNEASSDSTAPNTARILQAGQMLMV
jgi:hypothetical protein